MAKDPVCKMPVEEQTATLTSEYDGTRYYFCSPGCKESFDKDPEAFCIDTDILGRKRKTT
jgi:YHS domain-containing protein